CPVALFCFAGPAPTGIYTLSLHDALPISLGAQELDGGAGGPDGELAGVELRHGRGVAVRPTLLAEPRGVVDEVAGGRDLGRQVRDRKSIRLNSSHVKISYAVFCLKKKKR